MPIAYITLKMVFVLAWTTGDASNLSCQKRSSAEIKPQVPSSAKNKEVTKQRA
jgi:hypothetical protein